MFIILIGTVGWEGAGDGLACGVGARVDARSVRFTGVGVHVAPRSCCVALRFSGGGAC